jgi:hypothetical protein
MKAWNEAITPFILSVGPEGTEVEGSVGAEHRSRRMNLFMTSGSNLC